MSKTDIPNQPMQGRVYTGQNTPVVAANIYDSDSTGKPTTGKGTSSDANGNFSYQSDSDAFTISAIGFETVVLGTFPKNQVIQLQKKVYELPPVEIRPDPILPAPPAPPTEKKRFPWIMVSALLLAAYYFSKSKK